jgi:hypothetical protein
MTNETNQPDQAAIIAEKDARIAELETALDAVMSELDKSPSRIGQPVKVEYPFQSRNDIYTG